MDKSYEDYDIENYDYNYENEHSGNGINTDIDMYNTNKNTIQFLLILMIGLSCMPKWIEIGKYIFKSCKTSYKKKRFKIYRVKSEDSENLLSECCICLENYNKNEEIVILSCNHNYHKACILKWLKDNNSCPQCRENII